MVIRRRHDCRTFALFGISHCPAFISDRKEVVDETFGQSQLAPFLLLVFRDFRSLRDFGSL